MLHDRLASWLSDLSTLHELTERLTRTSSLDAALHELLCAGATLVGAQRGVVCLEPAAGGGPGSTVTLGLDRADLGHLETVPADSGMACLLADLPPTAGDEPAEVSHPDIATEAGLDPRHREVAARLGYAASYAVPISRERRRPAAPGPAAPAPAPAATPPTAGSRQPGPAPDGWPQLPVGDLVGGAPGCRIGAATWLYDEPGEPSERQRHLVQWYCRYAAEHIARQLELRQARQALTALRGELLPDGLPRVPGVQLAARHRTGPHGGGDWYDALPLPEGALGLAVGGVTGSGPGALAAMGRLRASLRAYAVLEGEDPVAVLSDLELLLRLTEPARSATALFAYCEPAGGTGDRRKVVLAGAGHCPPLIVGDRHAEFVESSLSAPLGMLACWEAPCMVLEAEPGETLLLYSDGLLHATGERMDRAFARLHSAAASVPDALHADPDGIADHVLRAVLPDGTAGDDAPPGVRWQHPTAPVGRWRDRHPDPRPASTEETGPVGQPPPPGDRGSLEGRAEATGGAERHPRPAYRDLGDPLATGPAAAAGRPRDTEDIVLLAARFD